MGLGVNRTRNHRRNGCSTLKKVTLAQYILSHGKSNLERLDFAEKNKFITAIDSDLYLDRTILVLYDGSFLGFFKDGRCCILDPMGRDIYNKKKSQNHGKTDYIHA